MSEREFTELLHKSIKNAADVSDDGAIHFVCMDWRHIRELLNATDGLYSEFKNLRMGQDQWGARSFLSQPA